MCAAFLVYCRALLDESVPQNVLETDAPCTVRGVFSRRLFPPPDNQISRVFSVTRPNGIARQSRNSSNGKFSPVQVPPTLRGPRLQASDATRPRGHGVGTLPWLLCRWCSQRADPPHFPLLPVANCSCLPWLLCPWCSQRADPPPSLLWLLCR